MEKIELHYLMIRKFEHFPSTWLDFFHTFIFNFCCKLGLKLNKKHNRVYIPRPLSPDILLTKHSHVDLGDAKGLMLDHFKSFSRNLRLQYKNLLQILLGFSEVMFFFVELFRRLTLRNRCDDWVCCKTRYFFPAK